MTFIPADLRDLVRKRAGNHCEYCRLSQESQVATFPVDHIVPVSGGGATELRNLALACPGCNATKWMNIEAIDPLTGERQPLFNPRTQVWNEHFRWSDLDPATIEPLTPTARATVALLELNSELHRQIHQLLVTLGKHPIID